MRKSHTFITSVTQYTKFENIQVFLLSGVAKNSTKKYYNLIRGIKYSLYDRFCDVNIYA